MPVSFNVPKQTPRSKYVIDTFQGVDFTSAGIDVDSSRSPYAPNMVRHTPGKVRKRMGYHQDIAFSNGVNTNLAKGTSAYERNFHLGYESFDHRIPLYTLVQTVYPEEYNRLYFEFDYRMTADETHIVADGMQNITLEESREWSHISTSVQISSPINQLYIYVNFRGDLYIKNFSVMVAKDAKYKWSPAPENGDVLYTSANPYVYGRHAYRTMLSDKKKSLVNVNRARWTSDEWVSYEIDSDEWIELYELQECVYTSDDVLKKRNIYIEFDYAVIPDVTSVGNWTFVSVAGEYSNDNTLERDVSLANYQHYSGRLTGGSYTNKTISVKQADPGGYGYTSATLYIKNMFVGYAIDDNYSWSEAPEDLREEPFTPNLYWEGKRNISEKTNAYYIGTQTTDQWVYNTTLINPSAVEVNDIKGFFYLSATISLAVDSIYNYAYADIYCVDNLGYTISDTLREFTRSELPNNYKYTVYASSGSNERFISAIGVKIYFREAYSYECSVTMSNIEVKTVTPREAYNVLEPNYDILHVGEKFFLRSNNGIQFIGNANLGRSWSEQMGDALIILDGTDIYDYEYGDDSITPISETYSYVPTITIARSPAGGGTPYESINLLSPGFIDSFVVSHDEASATQFQLSFNELDNKTVKAWVLNDSGAWVEKTQGTDFTVDRTTGVVTFTTAPGETPISGQDNVRIQAYKTIDGYRDRIAKCRFGAIYGVNGNPDRLFVSGNPDFPNRDYFSETNNYKYFPDTNYSNLGQASGIITGYTKLGNYLGTFKKESEHENSLILREGIVTANEDGSYDTVFKIVNTLQGEGPVSPYTMGYLESEPLYLTKKGIFAVTSNDGTENRYGQNRSYYLNGKLTKEADLENGYSTAFNNMYILALNNQLYILDGLQPAYSENEPYSTKQYSAFYCDSIPATCIWSDEDNLYFGTADGKICKFYSEVEDIDSYNDDGDPIYACWETPDLDGYYFYKNKTFRYFAIRLMKAFRTSYKLFVERNTVWTLIKEDVTKGRTFDFSKIDFTQFSFSTVQSEKVGHTKLRVKKVDKARFRIENSVINQAFGIYDLALEYIENGNYKR